MHCGWRLQYVNLRAEILLALVAGIEFIIAIQERATVFLRPMHDLRQGRTRLKTLRTPQGCQALFGAS